MHASAGMEHSSRAEGVVLNKTFSTSEMEKLEAGAINFTIEAFLPRGEPHFKSIRGICPMLWAGCDLSTQVTPLHNHACEDDLLAYIAVPAACQFEL